MGLFNVYLSLVKNKLEETAIELSHAVDKLEKEAGNVELQKVDIANQFDALKQVAEEIGQETGKLKTRNIKLESELKDVNARLSNIATIIRSAASRSPSPNEAEAKQDHVEADIKHADSRSNLGASAAAIPVAQLPNQKIQEKNELEQRIKKYKSAAKQDPEEGRRLHLLCDKLAAELLKNGKAEEAFSLRNLAASLLHFSELHPLYHMDRAINRGMAEQPDRRFGANFSFLDSGVLKGQHICGYVRIIDGNPTNLFQFNISHPARAELEETLKALQNGKLPSELKGKIDIQIVPHQYQAVDPNGYAYIENMTYRPMIARAYEVSFAGLGKVTVGFVEDPCHCLKNDIRVEVDRWLPPGQALVEMQKMISLLGLGPLFQPTKEDDQDRMVLAHLFRKFYPKEAFQVEQTGEFYEVSPAVLKNFIQQRVEGIEKNPARKEAFLKMLNDYKKIKMEDISWTTRGFCRYRISIESQKMFGSHA